MGSESEIIEERLKSLLAHLRTEAGILERIVYKNKNQHRRCLYFQYLLKVRRDVRLLLSASPEDILNLHFQLTNGNKPAENARLLEILKNQRNNSGKHNFHERLLGIARLLSQMVEPMLKTAIEISSLLARSFFMGFSLTILSLLARLRVLVQQMLLDVVSVFNMVSDLSQKKHSVKLTQDGIEVFREYYPSNKEVIKLECIWERDKFLLLEKTNKSENKNQNGDLGEGEVSLESSMVHYQSIEPLLEGDGSGCRKMETEDIVEGFLGPSSSKRCKIDAASDPSIKIDNRAQVEGYGNDEGQMANTESPQNIFCSEGGIAANTDSCPNPKLTDGQSGPRKQVAFVSVRKPTQSETKEKGSSVKAITTAWPSFNDDEDPFFSLLTGDNKKDSLF
ncbi:PREDICTED: uncharacterized protein LOC104604847 [Nelumbo nucifera]|uniref:Uncharacterized protein LOC104604847 n=1 Tax=Nelumbo nucifera TaxID=4432 RepID=A0A1U8AK79_NELNU|nr:PREDICTED: uncharacterized protein LOC104604847 [Nelumbo nucifera]